MASVNFFTTKKNGRASLYIRLAYKRIVDTSKSTGLSIISENWDHQKQKLRKTKNTPKAREFNQILDDLKNFVLDEFTLSYASGIIIDNSWLKEKINEHFNRPKSEEENTRDESHIYFVEFINWWLKEKSENFRNPRSRKKITVRRIRYLKNYRDNLVKFEKANSKKIVLNNLTPQVSEEIMMFLKEEENYGNSTMGKWVTRHNFLCDRAIENERILPKNYKCLYVPEKSEEILEPYLNEEEILKVYQYDYSDNPRLDNARDNFIIGLNTGLRISDFLRKLNTNNISEDFIEIETEKTGSKVAIPVHWMVKETLNKRFGMFPEKISDQKFNEYIKEICSDVGFDQRIRGSLTIVEKKKLPGGEEKNVKRKKVGFYEKHKLVSSHICRRSFATNLFGKVSNSIIMAVGGWKSERMMLKYIKKTNIESAQELKKYWDQVNTETKKVESNE